ncbi:MAG: hypothetical protein JW753_10460 [Dehalococcoidia bacterium]|nr:hypothetical protein [Dehalococcoidia bacterium]
MPQDKEQSEFDFKAHQESAIAAYLKVQAFYNDLATAVQLIVNECLKKRGIKVHSVMSRAKDAMSFGQKAASPSDEDPTKPKYPYPLEQITDLAGVRIITFFPSTLADVDRLLAEEFDVVERSDKGEQLVYEERFGYQSIHYLVRLSRSRADLAEYTRFHSAITEIQVRTILQHAWDEIEHDIQYKSTLTIPAAIRRRFMALAGLLEIADREFQAIQDADRQLTKESRRLVDKGQLGGIEITPDALRTFLDKKLGPDGRISDFSYEWTTRLLKKLGFRTLGQVDTCISALDDDKLSQIAAGSRQGQTTRFEYMLLAGMGEEYIKRHPWNKYAWFISTETRRLDKFKSAGVSVGVFDPMAEPPLETASTGQG